MSEARRLCWQSQTNWTRSAHVTNGVGGRQPDELNPLFFNIFRGIRPSNLNFLVIGALRPQNKADRLIRRALSSFLVACRIPAIWALVRQAAALVL